MNEFSYGKTDPEFRLRPDRKVLFKRHYVVNSKRLWLAIAILSFQLAFWLYHRDCISILPQENLDYRAYETPMTLFLGSIFIAFFALILPMRLNDFYSTVVWVFFIILVLPSWIIIYSLDELTFTLTYLLVVIIPVAALAIFNSVTKPTNDCQTARHPRTILMGLLLFAAVICSVTTNQIVVDFDLAAVYDRRAIFNDQGGTVGSYAVATLGHALVPIAIIFILVNRKWCLIPLVVAASLVPFVTSGSKISLISPLVIIAVWFFKSNTKAFFTPIWITFTLTVLVVLTWSANNQAINLYLGRRIFAVPTYLSIQYFKVFNSIGYLYGSDIPLLAQFIHGSGRGKSASLQVGTIITQQDGWVNSNSSVFRVCNKIT